MRSFKTLILATLLIVIILAVRLILYPDISSEEVLILLLVADVAAGFTIFTWVFRNLLRSTVSKTPPLEEEPTVSLLIPARNETHALEDSLKTALSIDYERLEIIALDDASNDSTPDIIRQFAQQGVRIVETGDLPTGWIGKNYALKRLGEESSGDLLVFCDVDTRLAPQSLTKIVSYMHKKHLDMISIVPRVHHFDLKNNLLSPLTVLWQLVLPGIFRRKLPPTSSSCWAVKRSFFEENQLLLKYPHAIWPQRYYAQVAALLNNYKFIIANDEIDVTTRKKFHSLGDSRIRSYYPLLNGNLGMVFIIYFLCLIALSSLFLGVWVGIFESNTTVLLLSFIAFISITIEHLAVITVVNPQGWMFGLFNAIPSLIYEGWLLLLSTWHYEFSSPEWKERRLPSEPVLKES